MNIFSIITRAILDSRGNPTVETEVILEDGVRGKSSVPAGASVGIHEAVVLPAADAIVRVHQILAPLLVGHDVTDQEGIDRVMCKADGTPNKAKLGANAILGVSLACARVAAASKGVPLYQYIHGLYIQSAEIESQNLEIRSPKVSRMMFNILNGGRHADFALDVQEFMVIPQVPHVSDAIEIGIKIRDALKGVLERQGITPGVGDEGGLTIGGGARISNEDGLKFLMEAISAAGYKAGEDIFLALDVAASEFYNATTQRYSLKCDQKELTSSELASVYSDWINKYPIVSLEDPFAQDDWDAWTEFTAQLTTHNAQLLLVGDDLFTTNIARLEQGIAQHAANAILIKPNQIGTLTETIDCVKRAQVAGLKVIVSHRSGETMDSFIADLAVAGGADYLKSGSPSQPVRMAKYVRLQEIEQSL